MIRVCVHDFVIYVFMISVQVVCTCAARADEYVCMVLCLCPRVMV